MSLATLNFITEAQFQLEKKDGFFGGTKYSKSAPIEIYFEMLNHDTGQITKHVMYTGSIQERNIFVLKEFKTLYAMTEPETEQLKQRVLAFLSDLSNNNWNVIEISSEILIAMNPAILAKSTKNPRELLYTKVISTK